MIPKITPNPSLYGPQGMTGTGAEKLLAGQEQLAPGKILSVTVMESRGQNIFSLKAGDLQLSVESSVPLAKGEQFQIQVLRSGPVLELQKLDAGLPAQVRNNLPLVAETINVKPLLQNLQTTLFPASGAAEGNPVQTTPSASAAAVQGGVNNSASQPSQPSQPVVQKLDSAALAEMLRQGNITAKATVVEVQGDNKTLLRIGGESFVLQGRMGAEAGEQKLLQLQSLQPTVSFLPVNAEGVANTEQPLLLANQNQTLPALLKALQLPLFTGLDRLQDGQQQLLRNLQSLHPDELQKPGSGEILKTNLEHLGLRSEALVAAGKGEEAAGQLKTVLAEVMKVFQGQEEISGGAGRLLATLENSQVLQLHLHNSNALLFPLPFSFLEKGYLMIEQEEGQKGGGEKEDDTLACTLHLCLEGLGNIRVRCVQGKDSIRIAFFLDSREKADFVSEFGDELEQSISSAPLLSLSFAGGAESPGSALLQNILHGGQSAFSASA